MTRKWYVQYSSLYWKPPFIQSDSENYPNHHDSVLHSASDAGWKKLQGLVKRLIWLVQIRVQNPHTIIVTLYKLLGEGFGIWTRSKCSPVLALTVQYVRLFLKAVLLLKLLFYDTSSKNTLLNSYTPSKASFACRKSGVCLMVDGKWMISMTTISRNELV